jgi:hypothetical protein
MPRIKPLRSLRFFYACFGLAPSQPHAMMRHLYFCDAILAFSQVETSRRHGGRAAEGFWFSV